MERRQHLEGSPGTIRDGRGRQSGGGGGGREGAEPDVAPAVS